MNVLLGTITDIFNTLLKRHHDKKMAKRLERDKRRELRAAATVVKHDTDTTLFNEELRTKVKETTHMDITGQGLKAIKQVLDTLDKAGR